MIEAAITRVEANLSVMLSCSIEARTIATIFGNKHFGHSNISGKGTGQRTAEYCCPVQGLGILAST
jgi:hypothetical protein